MHLSVHFSNHPFAKTGPGAGVEERKYSYKIDKSYYYICRGIAHFV